MTRNKLKIRSGLELTSMVDVVLLLITYFLVNATLIKNQAIKIRLPKSISAKSEIKKNIVVQITGDDTILLNNLPVTLTQLPIELQKMMGKNSNRQVTIKGDKEASYQSLISVIDYIKESGIVNFNLATERVR